MMKIKFSKDEIRQTAARLIRNHTGTIFLFYGEMGSGKTTLIQALLREWGVNSVVNSPTFSLVNEYENDRGEVFYHFDLYRLKSIEEALDIGLEEYLYSGNYCFIEWPELIEPVLTAFQTFSLHLKVINENQRELSFIKK